MMMSACWKICVNCLFYDYYFIFRFRSDATHYGLHADGDSPHWQPLSAIASHCHPRVLIEEVSVFIIAIKCRPEKKWVSWLGSIGFGRFRRLYRQPNRDISNIPEDGAGGYKRRNTSKGSSPTRFYSVEGIFNHLTYFTERIKISKGCIR